MIRARVETPYAGTGTQVDPYRPRLLDEYPVQSCVDLTGQPSAELVPNPNLYVVEVTCDEATLAAIQADSRYTVVSSEVGEREVSR